MINTTMKFSYSDAEKIHVMVEAKKIAFSDRYKVLGDPEKVQMSVSDILNEKNITEKFNSINMKKANNANSESYEEGSDTTYFLIVDNEGIYFA